MSYEPPADSPERQIAQCISGGITAAFGRIRLTTSDNVMDELIRSIKQYSEISKIGRSLLSSFGHGNPATAFPHLQSFARQGLAFFDGARNLHHRASPLLYYYSFLNLSKAICYSRRPNFPVGRIMHGLSDVPGPRTLRQSVVRLQPGGVFNILYETIMGIPFTSSGDIPVARLLGYISDCRWECVSFNYEVPRSTGAIFYLTRDATEADFRATLAVENTGARSDISLRRILARDFEPIKIAQQSLNFVFGIRAERALGYSYWRSKRSFPSPPVGGIPANEIGNHVAEVLSDRTSDVVYDEEFTFQINRAFAKSNGPPMNEFLAIYILMFFFGSLVRYRPSVLEDMLEKEDAWMIESVMRSTPLAFLRHARNALSGDRAVYCAR